MIGTILPTNYELVQLADAIVLARAKALEETDADSRIRFDVTRILKGDIGTTELSLRGHLEFAGRSTTGDYSKARRGAYHGACRAYDYRLDHDYLLFLVQAGGDDAHWRLLGTAFSRTNEEVDGATDPWITVVEQYVRIGALNDHHLESRELRHLLETEAHRIPGLGADIEDWLGAPSGRKPVDENIALFRQEGLESALWVLANRFHHTVETQLIMQELMATGQWRDYTGPVTRFFTNTSDAGPVDTFIEHYASARDSHMLLGAIVKLAGERQHPAMLELLQTASEDELRPLLRWYAANHDRQAREHISTLVTAGYGVDWQVALALAAMGDPDVLDWAINEPAGEQSWVADYVIARSPLAAADAARTTILKDGNPSRLINLVHAQRDVPAPDLELIYRVYERAGVHCKAAIRKNVEMLQRSVPEARSLLAALPPVATEASEDACY